MRNTLLCVLVALVMSVPGAATAVPPDSAFTQQMRDYVAAKRLEFLDQIAASGRVPTAQQEENSWCRALMWWKMSNPGGEAKLTLDGLIYVRTLEVDCGQRMRRPPPLPHERQAPPQTLWPPVPGGVINIEDPEFLNDNDGTRQAHDDFRRWHPDEYEAPPVGSGVVRVEDPEFTNDTDDPPANASVGVVRQSEAGALSPRRDFGSVDPMYQEAWAAAREPISIGANDEVGSGARRRAQAIGAATNILGGVLGARGASRGGPELARCRVNDRAMMRFESGDVALDLWARRQGDNITIFADVAQSPDNGTFQAVVLQDQTGQMLSPGNVDICALHGQWRLSVSWTQTTYSNGQQTGQQSGGWSRSGRFGLPGQAEDGDAADGLWRQLGFSNASHGAKRIAVSFAAPAEELVRNGAVLLVHVTRPSQDPVTTAPFALMLEEGPQGLMLAPCP